MTGTRRRTIGSRAEVWHGNCLKTVGGLKKSDLMKHKGRIVSRRKHAQGLKAIKRLFALGYKPKKGTFKVMRKSMAHGRPSRRGRSRRSRTRRGGASAPGVPDVTATGHKAQ
jgi:hypothetical protein